jgi:ribonuclease P protein component
MLPRAQRLSKAEFTVAFQQGRPLRHPLLQMRAYRRSPSTSQSLRAAFVAPKKLGKATVRNRARRRVRECYRLNTKRAALVQDAVLNDYDLIFFAAPGVLEATTTQIDEAITQLLRRLVSSREHSQREVVGRDETGRAIE